MPTLRNDFRWGHITLIDQHHTASYGTDPQGKSYVMDTHGGPYVWRLRCDCGYEWEITREQFPGRRVLRSCGRKECSVTAKPPKKPRDYKGAATYSLPLDLITQVLAYRDRKGINASKAAEILLYKGLAAALIDDEG